MKKLVMFLGLFICLWFVSPVAAQHISVNVNINLDRQPAWGPVGYDYVDFYYFPDINIYYDVNYGMFYYLSGRRWIATRYLPVKYARYDLYAMYKVPLINEMDPWLYNRNHKRMYAHYKGNRNQIVIYYANDNRYNNYRQNHIHWIDPGVTVKNNKSIPRTTTSSISNRGTTTPTTSSSNRSTTNNSSTRTTTTTNSGSNRSMTNSTTNGSTNNNSSTRTSTTNSSNRSSTNSSVNSTRNSTTNGSTTNSSTRSSTTNSSNSSSKSNRSTR